MTRPTTRAGIEHAESWIEAVGREWGFGYLGDAASEKEAMWSEVAAIEAEAVAAERARIRAAVEAELVHLDVEFSRWSKEKSHGIRIAHHAVLDIIDGADKLPTIEAPAGHPKHE